MTREEPFGALASDDLRRCIASRIARERRALEPETRTVETRRLVHPDDQARAIAGASVTLASVGHIVHRVIVGTLHLARARPLLRPLGPALSEGGFYRMPEVPERPTFRVQTRGFDGRVFAEGAGLIATALGLERLSRMVGDEGALAVRDRVLDFAFARQDRDAVLAAAGGYPRADAPGWPGTG